MSAQSTRRADRRRRKPPGKPAGKSPGKPTPARSSSSALPLLLGLAPILILLAWLLWRVWHAAT